MLVGSAISGLIVLFLVGDAGCLLGFFFPSVVLLVKINEKLNELMKNKKETMEINIDGEEDNVEELTVNQ